ncbi:MAG TPA: polysaccharide ABC transporter ATP-binding protein [Acidimicrobiales bacterium]|nr:polysaccharide ABC transporter ATP-binding protein [Acidimicrobiales bacterium]
MTRPPGIPKIQVERVGKAFKLPHLRETSIKSRVIGLARASTSVEKQQVLRDVSFEVAEGEFFGIIGRNGSGKSTLLKLLAGIYFADSGHVGVHGAITPFIELGVGFSPDLTGRENVYLNGALLGFDHAEMDAMYEGIVEFAELEPFMDLKLKNYSSGMQVRLAFAVAVRTEPDILLIDEVLAVGDASFQQKCFDYFYELKQNNRTIVFVSHDMNAVQRYCDRAIYIDKGIIRASGDTSDVISTYLLDVFESSSHEVVENVPESDSRSTSTDTAAPAMMLSYSLTPHEVDSSDEVTLRFSYEIRQPVPVELRFAITKDGAAIAHMSTHGTPLDDRPGIYHATFVMELRPFLDGRHVVTGGLFHAGSGEPFDLRSEVGTFYVRDGDIARSGSMRIAGAWTELPVKAG